MDRRFCLCTARSFPRSDSPRTWASETNFRKIRLRTTCLYSDDSTLPRSRLAESQSDSSKPFSSLAGVFLVAAFVAAGFSETVFFLAMNRMLTCRKSLRAMKVTIPRDKPRGIRFMPSGFMPVVIDLRPSMEVTIPRDKPGGIRFMPSDFMPVVFDLRPSMEVTIPRDKPRGIRFMPSGFMPVVFDPGTRQ